MEVLTIDQANIGHCHYHVHQPVFRKPSQQNVSLFTEMNEIPDREETPSPEPSPGSESPGDGLMRLHDPKTSDLGSPTVQDQNETIGKPTTRPVQVNPPTPPKTPPPKPKPKRHGESHGKPCGIVSLDPVPIPKPDGPVPDPDSTPKPDPDGEPGPDAEVSHGSCTKRYGIVFEDELPAPMSINKNKGIVRMGGGDSPLLPPLSPLPDPESPLPDSSE
ncbi:hypothetical protein QBC34DRAFT_412529 [Podospora aff. communis PSN243]|uniref:Uncharacterized protein n=1 Tax=Podospora aff. communis PSN243 TaxID=3040156 RepID=A0AAV9GBW3_9PEZI|nr:hypothetical protein QBC34DRAFT_412529 [Podospora aff. communis PSN243]